MIYPCRIVKAIVITRFGGPEVLELREVATPVPARGEVRVRVRASAVNRADLLQRAGHYPAPPDAPQDIPGLEYAGEVDAVGEAVTALAPGDRVFGLCGGGAYAEAMVAHHRTVVRIPDRLSFTEAAAIPEAFITAWDAMVVQGGLGAGEWALIHAVGSGVGTAAAQIAHAIGARVIGTARTRDKLERARPFGLDESILVAGEGFAADVRRVTGGAGADLVLELVGGSYVAEDLACLAPRGRIVLVGLTGGARAELDLAQLLNKRARLIGTVLRARPLEERIAAMQLLDRHLVPLIARGALRPVIDRALPLAQAAEAHALVAANTTFGKVVLTV
jgi:putative PIG3 family NAD(P)H quinone oxidoreductase